MVIIYEADEFDFGVLTHVPNVCQHAGKHYFGALVLREAEAAGGDGRYGNAAAIQLVSNVERVIDGIGEQEAAVEA